MNYTKLFSPITIGSMTVKNRIFVPPMSTHLADTNGQVTEELLDYYGERAKGGAGYITIPSVLIEKYSRYGTYRNLALYEDGQVENLAKLCARIHQEGAAAGAQLLHPAIACPPSYNEGRQPISPSALVGKAGQEIPRELSVKEIAAYVELFGEAAVRAKMAGFDAVEVHCCHSHGLLGRFLSPVYNKRCDAYGGGIEGRLRFLLEVVGRIREKTGPEYPIIVRMSATDGQPGGQSLAEGVYIAGRLEETGASMIHLSDGSLDVPWRTTAPSGTSQGFNREAAKTIRAAISIPLGMVGRINEPWVAEQVLNADVCDVVYMGRAVISDPDLPKKALTGQEAQIRPCIGCLQCLLAANTDQPFGCSVNPEAGKETLLKHSRKPERAQNILVLGGGPAGMTAALYAARRGHNIILAEKSSRLGGQMNLAAVPPCKQEITKYIIWLTRQLQEAGVRICLNECVSAQEVSRAGFDQVILAVGTDPLIPKAVVESGVAVTVPEVLEASVPVGKNVVIVGGGYVGCEVADFLLPPHFDMGAGRRVTIIEMADIPAAAEKTAVRARLMERLLEKHCRILTKTTFVKREGSAVICQTDGKEQRIEDVDTVISAVGWKSDAVLYEQLRGAGVSVHALTGIRNIREAVEKAFVLVHEAI